MNKKNSPSHYLENVNGSTTFMELGVGGGVSSLTTLGAAGSFICLSRVFPFDPMFLFLFLSSLDLG